MDYFITVLRGVNAAPTSAVHACVILLLLIIGDWNWYGRGDLHWYNVHTIFPKNEYIWAEV